MGVKERVCKSVAVISAQSPARLAAMACALADCVARHGWSERLKIEPAGHGAGAGSLAGDDAVVLASAGIRCEHAEYVEVESDPSLLGRADYVVVGSELEADMLLQWPGAAGKQVFAFGDYVRDDESAVADPDADLSVFCEEVSEVAPLVLRSLVASD
jgi:protein-tyrosine-phosphatase